MFNRRMAGVTLVELIIAIVIIGAALGGLVAAFTRANLASADPLVAQQALAIAETTMEEVMLKTFDALDGARHAPSAVVDVNGDPIASLDRYKVEVRVEQPGVDGVPAITGVPAGQARRIQVIVTGPGEPMQLTGWRTRP